MDMQRIAPLRALRPFMYCRRCQVLDLSRTGRQPPHRTRSTWHPFNRVGEGHDLGGVTVSNIRPTFSESLRRRRKAAAAARIGGAALLLSIATAVAAIAHHLARLA